jgi:hypothetical protein
MGIKGVNYQKLEPGKVQRPSGGGVIFGVNFRSLCVYGAKGFKGVFYMRPGGMPEVPEQKTNCLGKKMQKLKVYFYLPGPKGDLFVQGVIHL